MKQCFFKYIVNTTWNEKKSDWKRYVILKNTLKEKEKNLGTLEYKILFAKEKACICLDTYYDDMNYVLWTDEKLCDLFYDKKCNQNCPYFKDKVRYNEEKNTCVRLEEKIAKFWSNAFQKAGQRTK